MLAETRQPIPLTITISQSSVFSCRYQPPSITSKRNTRKTVCYSSFTRNHHIMNNPSASTNVSNAQILQAVKRLDSKMDNLSSEVRDVKFLLNPMSDPEFANLPVLGSDTSTLGTTNSSTYTWVRYTGRTGLIGAAHCALSLGTNHDDKLFVQVPESITQLGVKGVWLVRPDDPEFSNIEPTKTLPTKYDLIFIEVDEASKPSPETKLPEFEKSTPSKKILQHQSPLVGRSPVSVISSKDGVVDIDTNQLSVGSMSFFLDRGEPGDSGTLLLLKKDKENWLPRGVFVGIKPTRPGYGKQGLAATLPDRSQLCHFPILDLEAPEHSQLTSLTLVDWDPLNGARPGIVTIDRKRLNAVDCVYEGRVVAHGVIVKSNLKDYIKYIGKKDHAKLMGVGI